MGIGFHAFETRKAAVAALADDIARQLTEAVSVRSHALFLATGGTTPIPLYEALAPRGLPWDRVTVVAGDARWLPEADPGSNDGMIRRSLLQGPAAAARFLTFFGPEPTPEAALPRLRRLIAPLPAADMTLLGMGDDGHTASLFPGAEGLAEALDPKGVQTVVAMTAAHGAATAQRLSLTLSRLLNTRAVRLLFTGEAKRTVYDEALQAGPADELPVRAVLHRDHVPVEVFWAA